MTVLESDSVLDTPTITFAELPVLGANLAGGTFCGLTTLKNGAHAAVVLLPNKLHKRLGWQQAVDWARDAGGELPSRPVAALLYANAKPQFDDQWYWTGEAAGWDASYAWGCLFGDGNQFNHLKSYEGGVRAVRLLALDAA